MTTSQTYKLKKQIGKWLPQFAGMLEPIPNGSKWSSMTFYMSRNNKTTLKIAKMTTSRTSNWKKQKGIWLPQVSVNVTAHPKLLHIA